MILASSSASEAMRRTTLVQALDALCQNPGRHWPMNDLEGEDGTELKMVASNSPGLPQHKYKEVLGDP